MTRSEQREEVFILVFEKTFHEESIEFIIDSAKEIREDKITDYIVDTAKGVYDFVDKIDSLIEENSIGWKINRISRVALCILRIAIYEIIYNENVPAGVAINEAVELCKKYATDDEKKFVNGVLGAISKNM